jgi:hypothetical protein
VEATTRIELVYTVLEFLKEWELRAVVSGQTGF